ncbi:MAG TPA: energy coupling factor transporter S component ThiW [Chondromyces sp.]|nr:energy coupling factor transporter S component ThiW [Chondromyces sp.]
MKTTYRLTIMAMLIAIGTLGSHLLWIPAGVAKAYPVQHAVNVVSAVLLGPGPAMMVAFAIGLLRNMLGVGTLLAFPGGIIGAFLAGYFYRKKEKTWVAATGEIIGTGLIGSIVAVPIANLLMGTPAGAFAFVLPFLVSSAVGAVIAIVILLKVPIFRLKQNLLDLKK